MAKFYAGIGARKTPRDILQQMTVLGSELYDGGWTLRSGGAVGADKAFERFGHRKEIFTANSTIPTKAFEIAEELHPAWNNCKPFVKRLMARNVLQIMGQNLDSPVQFVVCLTLDGCESHATRSHKTGGTGQAISLASLMDIPVHNLFNEGRLIRVRKHITE
jgi:hypothetical protein